MKLNRSLAGAVTACGIAAIMVAWTSAALAQEAEAGSARVLRVVGDARYSLGDNVWHDLKAGDIIKPGTVLQTASRSSLDILLLNKPESLAEQITPVPTLTYRPQGSVTANVVRLYENTVLSVDKLTATQTGADLVTETQLDLRAGKIFGSVRKMSGASRYEIKYPNGVAGIRGTVFIMYASGVIASYAGTVTEAYQIPGQPQGVQTIGAGYEFDPATGKLTNISVGGGTADYQAMIIAIKQIGVLPPGAPPSSFAPDFSSKWVSPTIGAH